MHFMPAMTTRIETSLCQIPSKNHWNHPWSLAERLAGLTNVSACYQCKKCSAGCPLTFAMDFYPDQVIRLALLGQEDQVLGCRTIWVCSSCETCTTRCPNNIDIAGVMDWLKEEAIASGQASPQPGVTRFHQTFLDTVRLAGGRLSEPLLLGLYQWRRGGILENSSPAPSLPTCAWPGSWPGAAGWCRACPIA